MWSCFDIYLNIPKEKKLVHRNPGKEKEKACWTHRSWPDKHSVTLQYLLQLILNGSDRHCRKPWPFIHVWYVMVFVLPCPEHSTAIPSPFCILWHQARPLNDGNVEGLLPLGKQRDSTTVEVKEDEIVLSSNTNRPFARHHWEMQPLQSGTGEGRGKDCCSSKAS